jgi:DNA (cytosine-5)-methyltransferase 1
MRAVDLFAGWGGFTLGAELAGVRVVWAANHWPLAVEAHRANHPHVEHVCQDLRQADWAALPTFDMLLASPACQGHSTASQPRRRARHDAMRATAWAVVDCAEVTAPRAIVVENVPSFLRWQLFDLWCAAIARLGYAIDVRTLRASRHGVPQRRDRDRNARARRGPRSRVRDRAGIRTVHRVGLG